MAWAPDGDRLVFERREPSGWVNDAGQPIMRTVLFSVHANGTELVRLSPGSVDDRYPVWSPDGKSVAFVRSRIDAGYREQPFVYAMRADGSHSHPIAVSASAGAPSFSPDGGRIVFVGREGKIRIVRSDGADGHLLLVTRMRGSGPVWSPDGRQIAFVNPVDTGLYVDSVPSREVRSVATGVY